MLVRYSIPFVVLWLTWHHVLLSFKLQGEDMVRMWTSQECFDLGAAGQSRLMLLEMCRSVDFLNDWVEAMVMAVQHAKGSKDPDLRGGGQGGWHEDQGSLHLDVCFFTIPT